MSTEIDILAQKMREQRDESYRILSSSYEEYKSIVHKTRASLLEDLLQEVANIRKDIKRAKEKYNGQDRRI